jgi:phosphomethylpyrimidine synthase
MKIKVSKRALKKISSAEKISINKITNLLKSGRAVIPYNPVHAPDLCAIGDGLKVKVNVNVGTSIDYVNINEEVEKVKVAIKYGTDTIMDLSTGGDLDTIRKKILKLSRKPVGSVPVYQAGIKKAHKSGAVIDMTEDDIFASIEAHAKDGIDFMTVHCGVTKQTVELLKRSNRAGGIVSRGGAFLAAWIVYHKKENPLYSNFDYLLELANKYDFTLSLGDGLRPGCIQDASDKVQIQELLTLGALVERARKQSVQTIIEGPGHLPLNQIEANVRIEKTLCKGAPFYVLGPLVTDIAPGYDHIVAAIGGAIAAYFGADFICYVTPSEHLSLPTVEDVKEGLIAAKIAAHAADIAKGTAGAIMSDEKMAFYRKKLDWKGMFSQALDPEKAKKYRYGRKARVPKVCSMCGDLCAIKIASEYID